MNSTELYEHDYLEGGPPLSFLPGLPGRPDPQTAGYAPLFPKQWKFVLPLLAKIPVGLLALSTAKEILWANSSFLGLLDGEKDAAEGLRLREILSPKGQARAREWLQAVGSLEEEGEMEVWLRRSGEVKKRVRFRRMPSFPGLKNEHVILLSAEDISEPHEEKSKLERALEESQEQQEAQQRFLASMSHEIRNSANVIAGFIRSSEEGRFSHQELKHIQYTTGHLLHLTENLLYYSKIREDKFSLSPAFFNLPELLSALAQVPAVFLQNSPVSFEFCQASRIPAHCIGDKAAIYQILLNLLGNALKFTRQGRVILRVDTAGRDARGRTLLRFQVEDTGPGIPEDQLDAIFGRFRQGEGREIKAVGGYGLGLSISRQLAELMGGQITVSSKAGQGSTFEAILPLEEAPATLPSPSANLLPQPAFPVCSSPARVLVLEDDPLSRSFLESFLQEEGMPFHSCADGREALQALETCRFDLALLDLHTPLLSGIDVALHLRNSPENPNCHIPLIALSGRLFSAEEPALARAGIRHFLHKPYCPEQLRHLLRCQMTTKPAEAPAEEFRFSAGFDQQELQTLYGNNYRQLLSMFEAFLRNTPKALDNMAEMLEQEEWTELAGKAHKTKPSFSLVGWRPVSCLAREVEEVCSNGNDKSAIRRQFQRFKNAANEVLAAVDRENQRLLSFFSQHTPPTHAYPDRR
ncbi:MAG: response regulator [Phaeodactylibacter sp.]|nr:response regulator [Phaeodactylibacter sp.]